MNVLKRESEPNQFKRLYLGVYKSVLVQFAHFWSQAGNDSLLYLKTYAEYMMVIPDRMAGEGEIPAINCRPGAPKDIKLPEKQMQKKNGQPGQKGKLSGNGAPYPVQLEFYGGEAFLTANGSGLPATDTDHSNFAVTLF